MLRNIIRVFTPRALVEKSLREVYPDPSVFDQRVILPLDVSTPDSSVTASSVGFQALVDRHFNMAIRKGNRGALLKRVEQTGLGEDEQVGVFVCFFQFWL